ncbi:MAG: hypothetical protein ACLT38_08825 [Akkermansia sp.]
MDAGIFRVQRNHDIARGVPLAAIVVMAACGCLHGLFQILLDDSVDLVVSVS